MSSAPDFNATQVIIGPNVGIWWNVTIPAPNVRIELDENGWPPDGRPMGYTDHGTTLTIAWAAPPEEAWDRQEGYRVYMANQMTIEGTIVQVLDLDKLDILLPPAVRPGDGSVLTFGASAIKPELGPTSVLVVFPHQPNPASAKFGYALIYKAINSAVFTFAVNRHDLTKVNFRFEARPVWDRPSSDQLGQFTTLVP